jgi:oxygen-independent coproporphyrinogen-3 oxidase
VRKLEDSGEKNLASGAVDTSKSLGVYVHFPFCTSRCPYCDFAVAVQREIPHEEYADAVLAELSARGPQFLGDAGPKLVSIYFGGGTPGLWRPRALGRVLEGVGKAFPASADLEVTVEVNPGDLDPGGLSDLRNLGVNRVSFGAQAFQEPLLRRIGRGHDRGAITASFESAHKAGIHNLCADLMFGLPDQSMQDWRDSLVALRDLAPDHITAYALTVESGTRFGALDRAGKLRRPGEDEVAAMYSEAHDVLTAAGYEHYEISSYARPDRRSTHNSLYWTLGAYLGLGVSASSFRPLVTGGAWRFTNTRSSRAYLKQAAACTIGTEAERAEFRTPAQLEEEALWLGLRMSDGVDRRAHAHRHGHDPLDLPGRKEVAAGCASAGWLDIAPDRLRLLPAGFLFADEVAVRLWRGDAQARPRR